MQLRLALTLLLATALSVFAKAGDRRQALVSEIESCEAILQEFQASPKNAIPAEVLRQAKGLVIVNEFQAGFVFGGKGGYGIVLVRKADGGWSVPCFLNTGEASFGLQLGAKSVRTIFVLMDDAGTRLLYKPRFNFGVDAVAVAGPRAAATQEQTPIIKASIYAYQMKTGLYAGAKIKTGWLATGDAKNSFFYSTERTMPEILFSNWIAAPAEVRPLLNYVQSIAGN